MTNEQASSVSIELLHDLYRDVAGVSLPFEVPKVEAHRQLRERVLTQVASHLLPRMADSDAPAVVVLGGSTGAGKSTLFNSLLGREISPAGVLRPTTRRAMAAHHPAVHSIPLRDLADPVPSPEVPVGMILVDAPDLDSLERENRASATRLLESADLWVMVTTATRYGDLVPWQHVLRARDRGLQLAVVLNRVPEVARKEVRANLLQRLDAIGLGSTPMFILPELPEHEGLLPPALVHELLDWLQAASGRGGARAIVRRTAKGAVTDLAGAVSELASHLDTQREAGKRLRRATLEELQGPQSDVVYALEGGQSASGAASARWQNFARAGMALAPLSIPGSRAATTARAVADRTEILRRISADVEAAVVTLLADAVHDASSGIHREWGERDALDLVRQAEPASPAQARESATQVINTWKEDLAEVVGTTPARTQDLLALTSPEGAAALLTAGAGGVKGAAEAAEHFFGADAVAAARSSLVNLSRTAIGATAEPYLEVLRSAPDATSVARVRSYVGKLGSNA